MNVTVIEIRVSIVASTIGLAGCSIMSSALPRIKETRILVSQIYQEHKKKIEP